VRVEELERARSTTQLAQMHLAGFIFFFGKDASSFFFAQARAARTCSRPAFGDALARNEAAGSTRCC
jgi:hypothetical protein